MNIQQRIIAAMESEKKVAELAESLMPKLIKPPVVMPKVMTNPLAFLDNEAVQCDERGVALPYNTELGIQNIRFSPATSQAQKDKGILGKVTMVTPYATVYNITVFVVKLEQMIGDKRFAVRVTNPSYKQNNHWISDIKLTLNAQHQILGYVLPLIDQTSLEDYPNLLQEETLWYLEDYVEPVVDSEILTSGIISARSENQLNSHILGKGYFNTKAMSVNNCTVFAYALEKPICGRNFRLSILEPSYKDGNNYRSDIRMSTDLKRMLLRQIDNQLEQ